jgi:hypothetical protein
MKREVFMRVAGARPGAYAGRDPSRTLRPPWF